MLGAIDKLVSIANSIIWGTLSVTGALMLFKIYKILCVMPQEVLLQLIKDWIQTKAGVIHGKI